MMIVVPYFFLVYADDLARTEDQEYISNGQDFPEGLDMTIQYMPDRVRVAGA